MRLLVVLTIAVLGANAAQQQTTAKPTLLTLEQQQDLLEQLAQLQRQTQQLLAAQQSLAAVAAAATATGQPPVSVPQAPAPTSHRPVRQPQSMPLQSTTPKPIKVNAPGDQLPQPGQSMMPQANGAVPPLPQGPQINWGKCPELEPSEQEKLAKASVITKCLESTPLPGNITRESVEQHREQIAACALRAEGWFTNAGGYDFAKAEKEIKNKRLVKDLEAQVLNYHSQCKAESEEKYPTSQNASIIAQIQLYQACMDYFISDVCGIEVNDTGDASQFQ